jgi:hypothetical protein
MNIYRATIRGQFEFTTDVDADSPEEAREEAEMNLEDAMPEVQILMINSVTVDETGAADEQ